MTAQLLEMCQYGRISLSKAQFCSTEQKHLSEEAEKVQ